MSYPTPEASRAKFWVFHKVDLSGNFESPKSSDLVGTSGLSGIVDLLGPRCADKLEPVSCFDRPSGVICSIDSSSGISSSLLRNKCSSGLFPILTNLTF